MILDAMVPKQGCAISGGLGAEVPRTFGSAGGFHTADNPPYLTGCTATPNRTRTTTFFLEGLQDLSLFVEVALQSRSASGGCLHGGASFKREKAHFAA